MLPIPPRKTFSFGSVNFGLRIAGGQGDDPAYEDVDDQVCEQLLVYTSVCRSICLSVSLFVCTKSGL